MTNATTPKPITVTLEFTDAFNAIGELRVAADKMERTSIELRHEGLPGPASLQRRAAAARKVADEIEAATFAS